MRAVSGLAKRLPSEHQYRGLSISRVAGARLRILVKYVAAACTRPMRRRARLKGLKKLRGSEAGQQLLLLGLGPSAGNLNIEHIREEQATGALKVLALNHFFSSSFARAITPDYYVLADPHFFGDNVIADSSGLKAWEYLGVHESVQIFIPDRYDAPVYLKNGSRLLYFNSLGLEGFSRSVDPTRPRGFLSMTAYYSLALAGYLGFERILVAGIDNSQFRALRLTSDQKPALGANHFYDGAESSLTPLHNFTDGVSAFFEDVARLFHDLYLFQDLPIENLDGETLVDAFPVAADRLRYTKPLDGESKRS